MNPGVRLRSLALRSVTLASLVAVCWAPPQPSMPASQARPRAAAAAPAPAVPPAAPPAALAAEKETAPAAAAPAAEVAIADPFAATSWAAPAAPVVADAAPAAAAAAAAAAPPPAPPVPVAPPNPFVYVGSYKDGPQQVVMLLRGDQLLLVQQGETIDSAYRLDRITPGGLVMTYLPLQLRQSVPITDPV
jgi:hypothetical protein